MIEIEIDGQLFEAPQGSMIIEIADKANIKIPRFCYHKKLTIAANCRMCLVEVEKAPKPLPACATPVTPGMKVFTQSVKALDAQKSVMEFLLINHPLDCPICDQGGACELQDVSMGYGQDFSRYDEPKRVVKDENLGPLIATDMTRCIQCTRCVRFGQEITGVRELGVLGRGDREEIGSYLKSNALKSELSGNIIDLCPVGALTSKPFRFTARAWELTQYPSIAPHDCVGSHIFVQTRQGKVMRVIPRENEKINETWISDRDRFSYQGLYSPDRLLKPLIKIKHNNKSEWIETDWSTALDTAAKALQNITEIHGGHEMAGFISPSSTLEECVLFQKVLNHLGSPNIDHRVRQINTSDQDFMPDYPSLGMSLENLEKQDIIIIIGSKIHHEAPIIAHRIRKAFLQGAKIVVINPEKYNFAFDCVEYKKIGEVENYLNKSNTKNLNITVLLGALAHNHPDAPGIRSHAQKLAQKYNAVLGFVTEGANTAGAWMAKCIPSKTGYNFIQAITAKLRAYILLNLDPDQDCVNPSLTQEAFKNAECVVALSAYDTPALRECATVILPLSPYTETAGTYVNVEGRFQSFEAITPSLGESRPASKILKVLGSLLGLSDLDPNNHKINPESFSPALHIFPDNSNNIISDSAILESSSDSSLGIYNTDPIVRRGKALQQQGDIVS